MNKKKLYIISEDILTDAMKKTILAKELLETNQAKSISHVINLVDISRGTFYKYKDDIHKVASSVTDIVSIMLLLENHSGVLSHVITQISNSHANILTINQEIPLGNKARVSIYIETKNMENEILELLDLLQSLDGVLNVEFADGGK